MTAATPPPTPSSWRPRPTTAATASSHLSRLLAGRLLVMEKQGRCHYYRLRSAEVARAIEGLMTVATIPSNGWPPLHHVEPALREARLCYDHLAGRLGVAVCDMLLRRHHVVLAVRVAQHLQVPLVEEVADQEQHRAARQHLAAELERRGDARRAPRLALRLLLQLREPPPHRARQLEQPRPRPRIPERRLGLASREHLADHAQRVLAALARRDVEVRAAVEQQEPHLVAVLDGAHREQRRQHVVAERRRLRRRALGRRRGRRRRQPVLQFENDPFAGLLPDTGDRRQSGEIAPADGCDQLGGLDAGEHRKGDLRPDAVHAEKLHARGNSRASAARKLTAVRTFCRYLRREGLIQDDPSALVGAPKQEQKLPAHLEINEMEKLLTMPDTSVPLGRRDRAILELFYASGLRLSELAGLDWSAVDLENECLRVLGKGRKERIVPIGEIALDAVAELAAKYGEEQRARLVRGLAQLDAFWRAEDGDRAAREEFVRGHFAGDAATLERAFRQEVAAGLAATLPKDAVLGLVEVDLLWPIGRDDIRVVSLDGVLDAGVLDGLERNALVPVLAQRGVTHVLIESCLYARPGWTELDLAPLATGEATVHLAGGALALSGCISPS